ncbi:hypothetical protein DY000_02039107 [Brassica cretica]|uniref:Replication factor A C-terminal domain-containing protein n=1 Tax=Brassica cretica TaxID=69181 RepID=A0ABQ7BRH6_BRACR|nr:hypothetical protein DY000_02039107 [Brassica cretica]
MQRCPLFMSLFRVFIDNDVPPTIEYLSCGPVLNLYLWDHAANEFYRKFPDSLQTPTDLLAQNQDVSAMVNASEVTGQDANHSGLASLRCPKCGNVNATEIARLAFVILTFLHRLSFHSKPSALQYMYLSEILAYDKDEKTTFVLLSDVGPELTVSEDSDYKFTAMRQIITVTKIVSIALMRPLPQAVEIPIMQCNFCALLGSKTVTTKLTFKTSEEENEKPSLQKALRRKHETSDKSSKRVATQRPGPLLNLYLRDHAANEFYRKFTDSLQTPTDLLAQNQDVSAMVNESEVTGQDANHSDCQTKVNRGLASLRCPKCGNVNATEIARYLSEILAYDKDEKAIFVLLGDVGPELTVCQFKDVNAMQMET